MRLNPALASISKTNVVADMKCFKVTILPSTDFRSWDDVTIQEDKRVTVRMQRLCGRILSGVEGWKKGEGER